MNRQIGTSLTLFLVLLSSAALVHGGELTLHDKLTPLDSELLGPFTYTSDGKILAIDSKATFVSEDGGKTWSDPRLIFPDDKGIVVSNERAILRTKDGTMIAAFMNLAERHWTWQNDLHDAPGARLPTYVMRSTDDGLTWQHVQKLHDNWSGAVRDMIQTKDGRIVFTAMKFLHDPGRHTVLTYSSTDDGVTWEPSNLIDLGGRGHHGGVTEATIIQKKDGTPWILIRTNWGQFWSGYSTNGGRHWQILQPSGIPSSSSPGMLTRLSSGRLMLLWNRPFPEGRDVWPLSGGDGLWSDVAVSNHREELSVAFSDDDGETWTGAVVLAKKAKTSLAYPYVFEQEPGKIWLTTMQGGIRVEFSEAEFVKLAAASSTPTTTQKPGDLPVIVAFGDSTTAPRPGAIKQVYADRIAEILDKSGAVGPVYNAGVGGNTSEAGKRRFSQHVLARQPSVVVIMFGLNDAAIDVWKNPPATESRVPLAQYEDNIRWMVAQVRANDARPVLMTTNPLRWTPQLIKLYGKPPYRVDDADGFDAPVLSKYNAALRQLAKDLDVPLIDVHAAFTKHGPDKLLLDGMHPNDKGHEIIAELLTPVLQKVLSPSGEREERSPAKPE
jgi:sialidase-1